jgi:hypothetical protein
MKYDGEDGDDDDSAAESAERAEEAGGEGTEEEDEGELEGGHRNDRVQGTGPEFGKTMVRKLRAK